MLLQHGVSPFLKKKENHFLFVWLLERVRVSFSSKYLPLLSYMLSNAEQNCIEKSTEPWGKNPSHRREFLSLRHILRNKLMKHCLIQFRNHYLIKTLNPNLHFASLLFLYLQRARCPSLLTLTFYAFSTCRFHKPERQSSKYKLY